MNSPFLHHRIDRAYSRMILAKSETWAHRWGDVFVLYCRARNSLRTPGEVRRLERARGLA